jgi:aryl-alcohol dehydrogenase-like predicted oxidoreductase
VSATNLDQLEEALAASRLTLDAESLATLNAATAVPSLVGPAN